MLEDLLGKNNVFEKRCLLEYKKLTTYILKVFFATIILFNKLYPSEFLAKTLMVSYIFFLFSST